jgi:hypothetical protein
MALDPDVQQRLEAAVAGATSWGDVFDRLRAHVPEGEEARHQALLHAFAYDLVSPDETDRLAREGSVFGAIFEFTDGRRMPPRLDDVADEDVAVWIDAFDAVNDPRLRSRIGDLLWSRKAPPSPHLKGRAACEALIELSRVPDWRAMESTEGLVRALDLARELSDAALVGQAAERMVEVASTELERTDRPGIPFSVLRALTDLRPKQRPQELLDLVRRAANVYGDDPHNLESAIELEVALARTEEERAALRTRQAELWRATAAKSEGILRASFLEKALDVARTHGLKELARELRVEIQSITEKELDLKTVSAEVKIDRDELERYYSLFVRFDSWEESLTAFGSFGPPGGDLTTMERQVDQEMQAHLLQYLVTKVVIDADFGVPIWHARDDASHKVAAMAQARWMATQFWSMSAVEILERFAARYARPSRAQLTSFFTSTLIDEAMAERIALAFELWWDDRPDESAHVLVPRIEAAVRNLAREIGLPIITEPYGGKPGKVRPLGELLHQLRDRFGSEDWRTYLVHLLVDPLGLNLRNVIAHGVRARVERADAALLLHSAAFLRLVRVG